MDDRFFRNAMGKFPTGVTVITAEVEGLAHGMTANAFMSVSLNPMLVLVSISEKANMLSFIQESGRFAVNILESGQSEMSMRFAGQLGKVKDYPFGRLKDVPVLTGSLATVVCRVYSEFEAGDHTLFLGEVEDMVIREGDPLVYYEGSYRRLSDNE